MLPPSISSFTFADSFIFFAFAAKFNVDKVYEKLYFFPEIVPSKIVFEFPPKESLSIFVTAESL